MRISKFRRLIGQSLENFSKQNDFAEILNGFEVSKQWGLWDDRAKNPLTMHPRRYWSQADEDGILAEIFARIPIHSKIFVEFGCGDGLQNNTLALIAKGWRGGWIDGIPLQFKLPSDNKILKFQNTWVTRENVCHLLENSLPAENDNTSPIALLSIDLDGNDFHFLAEMLIHGFTSDVIVLEYNARFPVGAKWVMPYNGDHTWEEDDYFGASLTSYCELLNSYGYRLVACSIQGSNAFFVNDNHASKFDDINSEESEHYRPPHYYLIHQGTFKASPKTVLSMLTQMEEHETVFSSK